MRLRVSLAIAHKDAGLGRVSSMFARMCLGARNGVLACSAVYLRLSSSLSLLGGQLY